MASNLAQLGTKMCHALLVIRSRHTMRPAPADFQLR